MADWGYTDEDYVGAVPQPDDLDSYLRSRLMNPPQQAPMPSAPAPTNLAPPGFNPTPMMQGAFRNQAWDVYRRPNVGPDSPEGMDMTPVYDPVASEQNRMAAAQGLQDLATQQMFEARTGYANPKAQKAAKWANVAGGIFDNFAAPVASMFGGRGAAEGVTEYLKGVNKMAEGRQKEVDARRQNALTGLKQVMDMMGKSSKFTQDNIDNYFNMLKTQESIGESRARQMQAMEAAKANAALTGDRQQSTASRQLGDIMDYQKTRAGLGLTYEQSVSQKKLQEKYGAEKSLKDARREQLLPQEVAKAKAETGAATARGKLANNQMMTEKERRLKLQAETRILNGKEDLKPIKDKTEFIKHIPARFSDAKGQKLAHELAKSLQEEEGISEEEAMAKTIALLENQGFKETQSEKKSGKGAAKAPKLSGMTDHVVKSGDDTGG